MIDGDVTLTLDGAAIEHTTVEMEQYAPAISVKKGHTTLILSGDNTVEGSPGYAGIYVAKEASDGPRGWQSICNGWS